MPILTMSHEIGAGGPEIAQKVAERLGSHYVDQELISEAALRYGLSGEALEPGRVQAVPSSSAIDAETRRYITVLQTALYEFAEKDRVVLMGRAGQWLLRASPTCCACGSWRLSICASSAWGKKLSGQMGEQTNPRTVHDMAAGAMTWISPGACATSTRWT